MRAEINRNITAPLTPWDPFIPGWKRVAFLDGRDDNEFNTPCRRASRRGAAETLRVSKLFTITLSLAEASWYSSVNLSFYFPKKKKNSVIASTIATLPRVFETCLARGGERV